LGLALPPSCDTLKGPGESLMFKLIEGLFIHKLEKSHSQQVRG